MASGSTYARTGGLTAALRTRVQEASQRHYVRAYRRPHSGRTYARTYGREG